MRKLLRRMVAIVCYHDVRVLGGPQLFRFQAVYVGGLVIMQDPTNSPVQGIGLVSAPTQHC